MEILGLLSVHRTESGRSSAEAGPTGLLTGGGSALSLLTLVATASKRADRGLRLARAPPTSGVESQSIRAIERGDPRRLRK